MNFQNPYKTSLRLGFAILAASLCANANAQTSAQTGEANPSPRICDANPSTLARQSAVKSSVPVDREIGYALKEIRDGVFFGTDGNTSFAVITTGQGVVIVDMPPSLTGRVISIVASVTDEPITHIIYSHAHADHIGGAAALPDNIIIIASKGAAAELNTVNTPDRRYPFGVFTGGGQAVPMPDVEVDRRDRLVMGNKVIDLIGLPSGHSDGDLLVHLPDQKVLVAVDHTWPGSTPWVRLGDAVNVMGLMSNNKALLDLEWDTLIAGHLDSPGTRADVENTAEFLNDLKVASVDALKTITVGDIAAETQVYDPYDLMNLYFDTVIETAAAPVIAKWTDRLQGAGIWTCDHAQVMIASLRFDEVPHP